MPNESTRLSYEITVLGDVEGGLKAPQRAIFEKWRGKRGSGRVDVTLGERALRVDYAPDIGESIHVDIPSGRRTMLFHRTKQRLVLDHGAGVLRGAFESWSRGKVTFPAVRKRMHVAGRDVVASRIDIRYDDLLLEAWAAPSIAPAAVGVFWSMLTGANVQRFSSGAPLSLALFSSNDASEPIVTVRLVEIGTRKLDESDHVGYSEIGRDRPVLTAASVPRHLRAMTAEAAPRTWSIARTNLRHDAFADRLRPGLNLLPRGDDCAWVTNQPALDELRTVVNALTRTMGTFSGDGEGGVKPLHVVVDWFQKLEPHLDFRDSTFDAIREYWTLYRVMNGQSLFGMSDGETARYQNDVLAETGPSERVLKFYDVFTSDRRSDIADACFAELTKPVVIDSGQTSFSATALDLLTVNVWDFDTDVTFDDRGILEELKYHRWKLRLLLRMKMLYTDFQFSTVPASTALSVILAILTVGGSALTSTNYGTGYGNIDDARIALDVSSVVSSGALAYRVDVNHEDSDMDSSAFAFGVNLGQDVLGAVAAAVVSWCNVLNGTILDGVAEAVESVADSFPLEWTAMWNAARSGPQLLASGSVDGTKVLRGVLATSPADMPASNTLAVPYHVTHHGFGVSRQHMSAWVRNIASEFGEDRIATFDWEGQFGITLPDISTLSLPVELQQLLNLQTREQGRYYRTRIVRHRPTVAYPQQGAVTNAGTVEMLIDVYLEAVTRVAATHWTTEGGFTTRAVDRAFSREPFGTAVSRVRTRRGWDRDIEPRAGTVPFDAARPGSPIPVPGPPGVPDIIPDFLDIPDEPVVGFEPPRVVGRTIITEHAFHRLIDVRLKVTATLRLGFSARGDVWLPELTLGLLPDAAVPTQPALAIQLVSAATNAPLSGIPSAALFNFVQSTCLTDALEILRPAVLSATNPPRNRRTLVPEYLGQLDSRTQELVDLVTFVQTPTPPDEDSFDYYVDGDMLYWGVAVNQTVASRIV